MADELRYCDDYAVDLFDHVLFDFAGYEHDGQVTKLHARTGEVTIKFEKADWLCRRGERRKTSVRMPVHQIAFERRDG
jgi:hypothetical protein